MKTIGMLGGMSWESTLTYYRLLNEGIKNSLGGLHSASICMVSVDFDAIEKLQHADDWDAMASQLSESALAVERGGADFLIICTNTMHKIAPEIEQALSIPLLHIADATAQTLLRDGIQRVGLLGTRFTMEQAFYSRRIVDNFGIDVLIPHSRQREFVHKVIYEELCLGKINPQSKTEFLAIIAQLAAQGAQAVILGCTEIAMLVEQRDTDVPLYDTTSIHAKAAIDFALSEPQDSNP